MIPQKKSYRPSSTREIRSDCSIQFSGAESINEQIAMLTSHINTLKNKQKLIADSLNDQTLKTTMAEVVSQALSSEVGPLVEASVKKLTPSHEPATFDANSIEIIKQEVYTSLKIDFDVLVEKSLKQYDLRMTKLESSLKLLDSGLSKLQNSLKPIQSNVDRLSDQFDQMKLSNQLVLFGLKEDPYPEASESRFLGFCSTRFPGIPVTQNDIVSARRIGKQGSGLKPRPLVVEFCSSRMQQLILREKKCLQGSGVFISESLTKSRLQLLNYTKSKLGKRSTWSSGGEILTKLSDGKVITVKEASQVDTLLSVNYSSSKSIQAPPRTEINHFFFFSSVL